MLLVTRWPTILFIFDGVWPIEMTRKLFISSLNACTVDILKGIIIQPGTILVRGISIILTYQTTVSINMILFENLPLSGSHSGTYFPKTLVKS